MVCRVSWIGVRVYWVEEPQVKSLLFALLLCSCAPAHAYMMPVIEVRCPFPTTNAQCQSAIRRMCEGSSYLIVMDERNKNERIFYVSCERSQ